MHASDKTWIDGIAVVSVMLLFPFYIGYIDSPLEIMLMYAIAGGLALAVAETLLSTAYAREGLRGVLFDAGGYALAVLLLGLIPFEVAIWLI